MQTMHQRGGRLMPVAGSLDTVPAVAVARASAVAVAGRAIAVGRRAGGARTNLLFYGVKEKKEW